MSANGKGSAVKGLKAASDEEIRRLTRRSNKLRNPRRLRRSTTRTGKPQAQEWTQRLRAETTMTLRWIADRLRMGSRGHLTHLLYWQERKKPGKRK